MELEGAGTFDVEEGRRLVLAIERTRAWTSSRWLSKSEN
ncbi:MAG: hypothetical protein AVDCRST_MAG55-753 [uncultured Rubrobacteraceae bacterium]|uniref:Uncharacterized protein n=1 Tax=uncultured Rubrobacteraceae bacterium TaxID=349277 RepID=A0A6J4P030_9ACTN|nr:MAG: hypothetical protein AVDCRST_MAG55-753 [uncultured Rubrobacteraceae bacterium]